MTGHMTVVAGGIVKARQKMPEENINRGITL